jgi:hypothetical protein
VADKGTIEVLNRDGSPWRVNGEKFEAMRVALLAVLPDEPPGMTVDAAKAALLPHLDAGLFPGGEKTGWWIKAVQLDHEARGLILRGKGSPVRLYRAKSGA